jgi:hypothetical protein
LIYETRRFLLNENILYHFGITQPDGTMTERVLSQREVMRSLEVREEGVFIQLSELERIVKNPKGGSSLQTIPNLVSRWTDVLKYSEFLYNESAKKQQIKGRDVY